MGLQSEWMLQCYLWHNILSEREKIEQRGEKCRTPVTISAPVSEVTLLSRTFSLSLSLGVFTLQWAWVLLRSSCVCLPLVWSTELDSTFPSGWQPAAVCVCSSCEKVATGETWPCENSRWQTDETWTLIDSERAINGTYRMPWNQLVAGCSQRVIKSLLNFYLVLLPLPETFDSQIQSSHWWAHAVNLNQSCRNK